MKTYYLLLIYLSFLPLYGASRDSRASVAPAKNPKITASADTLKQAFQLLFREHANAQELADNSAKRLKAETNICTNLSRTITKAGKQLPAVAQKTPASPVQTPERVILAQKDVSQCTKMISDGTTKTAQAALEHTGKILKLTPEARFNQVYLDELVKINGAPKGRISSENYFAAPAEPSRSREATTTVESFSLVSPDEQLPAGMTPEQAHAIRLKRLEQAGFIS
jgi:hypothetical protein